MPAAGPEVGLAAGSGEAPALAPWHLRLFFGGGGPGPDALRVLRLVALGMFFENYDIALLNAVLPEVARDLRIAEADTGFYTSAIRLGGIGAFLIVPWADRVGRRRIFLLSLIGMSVGTLLSGISQSPLQFALFQMLARVFMLTAMALSVVILVEEFPAEHRGAGLGLLSVLGGLGYGLASLLYAAVDVLPFGWRALYAIGVLPLVALPLLRRSLRETRRFEAQQAARRDGVAVHWLAPIRALARSSRARLAGVALAGVFSAMGGIVVFQYTNYFVRTEHGWEPGAYSLLVLGGGVIGLLGNLLGGRGSDRFGRRAVGTAALLTAPCFALLLYRGPEATLVPAWGLYVLCASAGDLVIRAFAAELFPTSQRGTSTGLLLMLQTIGWSLGLLFVGIGTRWTGELAPVVTTIAMASAVAAVCLLLLPETGRRELEDVEAARPA